VLPKGHGNLAIDGVKPSTTERECSKKRIYVAAVFCAVAGGQALAADLPPPVAPPPRAPAVYVPVAQVYNWTGIYIGANAGVGFGQGSYSDTFGSAISTSNSAKFLGGGQIGANYQFWGGAVIGAEAMFDWLPNTTNTITATAPLASAAAGATATATINNRSLTTATGKLGFWENWCFQARRRCALWSA
jgi:opacity protein-like surface antigen